MIKRRINIQLFGKPGGVPPVEEQQKRLDESDYEKKLREKDEQIKNLKDELLKTKEINQKLWLKLEDDSDSEKAKPAKGNGEDILTFAELVKTMGE